MEIQVIEHDTAVAAVTAVLKEYCGKTVTPRTRLETIVEDSLDVVEILLDLENEFDFLTTQKQVDSLITVNDLVELVKNNGTSPD